MNKKDHNAVVGEELNKRTEMNIGGFLGEDPFSAVWSVLHVVRGNYEIPPRGTLPQWLSHCF